MNFRIILTVLYQFLETGTSHKTFMGRDQEPIPPFIFLNSPLIVLKILNTQSNVLLFLFDKRLKKSFKFLVNSANITTKNQ